MRGKIWTAEHTATLHQWGGKMPDATIARMTGHSERTIRARRNAAGISPYVGRADWTRRDWLLHSAAGLDFQIPDCRK